ncbi:MAG: hypothetical protein ACLPUT_07250 [Solirubrobacteraceae bacterium]
MSDVFENYFDPITTGVSVPHISEEQILAFRVPITSLPQQAAIVTTLQGEEGNLQHLRVVLERQLELVEERRQALITAAVTGQLDIPGAA